MTSSNGNIFRVTGPLRGEFTGPVNSPHRGQWRGALMFSLICVWIKGWVNNREAGDLRRHRGHYDVTVMCYRCNLFSHWLKTCSAIDKKRTENLKSTVMICLIPPQATPMYRLYRVVDRATGYWWWLGWSRCLVADTNCTVEYIKISFSSQRHTGNALRWLKHT